MHYRITPRPSRDLAGRRVLVVEDEALVAMLVGDSLQEAGATVIGPAATVDEALSLLGDGAVDAAVLDVNLRGHRMTAVADRLAEMNVPFVIATGYDYDTAGHADAPMLQKPFDLARLTSALVSII
ncbi:response regulator [Belnapia arida]|uniref:response regulator n=1 Tax=Belnapia arida TaxID=2804533 RepID=UPI002E2B44BA|nr:response regulator [Belnapia arida]